MKKLLYVGLGLLLSMSFAQETRSEDKPNAQVEWKKQMQDAKTILTDLMPLVVSDEAFRSPRNHKRISTDVDQLLSFAQAMNHGVAPDSVSADPTVNLVSDYFQSNLKSARSSFKKGRLDHARFLLLNTTSYCIECHTRTQAGPHFVGASLSDTLTKLDPIEKVEYLISVRQYDDALKTIETTIIEQNKLPLFGAEKLVRYGLAITVKYLNNPDAALKLLELSGAAKNLPYFVKDDLQQWKKSVQIWKKEEGKSKIDSVTQIMTQAQKLITSAEEINSKQRSSNAGHVEILRANALLTGGFQKKPDQKQTAKMLYLVGQTYQMIPDHLLWTLHESFYASCIQRVPHSPQAKECYKAYEESIIMGYSGSSGTHLPPEVMTELNDLRKLSDPQNEKIQIK
ncbi:MAG: hypothetical protein ACK5WZ_11590 [Pseudobdellovibrionaceae bacterium]